MFQLPSAVGDVAVRAVTTRRSCARLAACVQCLVCFLFLLRGFGACLAACCACGRALFALGFPVHRVCLRSVNDWLRQVMRLNTDTLRQNGKRAQKRTQMGAWTLNAWLLVFSSPCRETSRTRACPRRLYVFRMPLVFARTKINRYFFI